MKPINSDMGTKNLQKALEAMEQREPVTNKLRPVSRTFIKHLIEMQIANNDTLEQIIKENQRLKKQLNLNPCIISGAVE